MELPKAGLGDFVGDGLSEVTRKERRNLLLSSTIGIAIVAMEMKPSQISALGLTFGPDHQSKFLALCSAIVFYFFWAFFISALADALARIDRLRDNERQLKVYVHTRKLELEQLKRELTQLRAESGNHGESEASLPTLPLETPPVSQRLAVSVIILRSVLDTVFPLLFGAGAFIYLTLAWYKAP